MFLALAEYRGNLFAGGYTSHFESVQYPYLQQFDGVSWSNPGAGIWTYSPYSDHKVLMLTQAFGKLFVGGQFELAGDQYVDNLATWDGAAWKEVGGGVGGNVMAGREYGAEFIVGGNMQLVGGYPNAQRSYFWSRWTVGGEPWIAEQPQGVEFEAGMSVDASVLAAEGYDIDARYAWMHDGRLISDGPGGIAPGGGMVEGSSSSHLYIKGAQAVDAGDFACVVSNDCGQSTSWAAWIRTPCAADHDRSGFLDRDDFDEFVSDFEAGDPAADFDCSGFVDADDFEAFVASYLQGCG